MFNSIINYFAAASDEEGNGSLSQSPNSNNMKIEVKLQDSSGKLSEDAQRTSPEDGSDPITGVLKLKKDKNKKTKEVSLTLNHNNLQQLVTMLQAHSATL
jgi:hypothetical protein